MKENELKNFMKQNSPLIFEYMNTVLLKEIGEIHPSFFVRLVDEFFKKEEKRVLVDDITPDRLSYFLIVEILGEAKQAYPFFRKDTLTLDELYKEVKVYYNHVKFTIEENDFCIYLIQTKAGVTAFDEEIIKFSKVFPMNTEGIESFISKNSTRELNDTMKKIEFDINNIL